MSISLRNVKSDTKQVVVSAPLTFVTCCKTSILRLIDVSVNVNDRWRIVNINWIQIEIKASMPEIEPVLRAGIRLVNVLLTSESNI